MPHSSGASRNVSCSAAQYLCEKRLSRARVAKPPPYNKYQATRCEVLGADVAQAKVDVARHRVLVLSLCDFHLLGRAVVDESSGEFIRALECGWLTEGSPETPRVDAGTGFNFAMKRSDRMDVLVKPAAGGVHTSTAVVEPRHIVFGEALDIMNQRIASQRAPLRDRALLIEGLIHVPHQVHRLAFTKGFSPCQWVLGMDPNRRLGNSADKLSLVTWDAVLNETTFQGHMAQQTAATPACVKAASSLGRRRALLCLERAAATGRREDS